jgi:hypothetical protein
MAKKIKNEKPKIKGIRKWFNWLAGGVLALHLVTQFNSLRNDYVNQNSVQRIVFEEKYGCSLLGWREDIEEHKKGGLLSLISKEIYKEKLEGNVKLRSLRISSDNYLKKSIWEQIQYLTGNPSGFYLWGNLVISEENGADGTCHHEIKHIKTDIALKKHPDLLKRWAKISTNENGVSTYRGLFESRNKEYQQTNLEKLGFISKWARENVQEDIAELGTYSELDYGQFIELLYGSSEILTAGTPNKRDKMPLIIKKINLAQETRIIPPEFTEFIGIYGNFVELSIQGPLIKEAQGFSEDVNKFLFAHPTTVYECALRQCSGSLIKQSIRIRNPNPIQKRDLKPAMDQYNLALESKFKDSTSYFLSLVDLGHCFSMLGESEVKRRYDSAQKEYRVRFSKGDLLLPMRGVNDYLRKEGLLRSTISK